MNKKIQARFDELEKEMQVVIDSKFTKNQINPFSDRNETFSYVDGKLFKEWSLKVKNLLILCAGEDSMYYNEFKSNIEDIRFDAYFNIFKIIEPIFKAAKNDYENGFLSSMRSLITAEVFDNELEQAQELLNSKYHVAAAVIAGTVLETAIRELCDSQTPPIAHGKLDKMNADLKKAGAYNQHQSKKITALADIRNSAAHGKITEFTHDDVQAMIKDIESFLANHLSD